MLRSVSIIIIIILSCARNGFAQDSFHNPNTFTYLIEYSSELSKEKSDTVCGVLAVRYDALTRVSSYQVSYKDGTERTGRILDKTLEQDRQVFLLEAFFPGKKNAVMSIIKGKELTNMKVAMIYYSNQDEDTNKEKTCICLILLDSD